MQYNGSFKYLLLFNNIWDDWLRWLYLYVMHNVYIIYIYIYMHVIAVRGCSVCVCPASANFWVSSFWLAQDRIVHLDPTDYGCLILSTC